jgi:hypothetical protein
MLARREEVAGPGPFSAAVRLRAEQGPGADCLQRLLVPRSRFRQRLRPGVRWLYVRSPRLPAYTPVNQPIRRMGHGM